MFRLIIYGTTEHEVGLNQQENVLDYKAPLLRQINQQVRTSGCSGHHLHCKPQSSVEEMNVLQSRCDGVQEPLGGALASTSADCHQEP